MKQKILLIGGTGTISSPITKILSQDSYVDLYLLNRGKNNEGLSQDINFLMGDINDSDKVNQLIGDHQFDVVVNFILFNAKQAQEQVKLFKHKTSHYVFVSTVAVLNHEKTCNIDERSAKGNRFSKYGQNKALAEDVFLQAYKDKNFPITIVRPAQTYSNDRLPLSVKGTSYWPVIQRMIDGKKVIIHGDGQSVWASTHADDFAAPFVSLLGYKETIGEIYQIINNKSHTWDMVYQEIAKQLKIEYRPVYISKDILKKSDKYDLMTSIQGDKTFSNIYDTSKIKAWYPEFNCEIDIKEGIRRFLNYADKNPEVKVKEAEFDSWCDTLINKYENNINNLMNKL